MTRVLKSKWLLAVTVVALAAVATACDPPPPPPGSEFTFSGSGDQTTNRYTQHPFTLSSTSDLRIEANWTTSNNADVNIFLIDPGGVTRASANSMTAKPEIITYTGARPGQWKLAVYIRTGSAAWSAGVDVTFRPAFPGDVPAGTVRWGSSREGGADPAERHEVPAGAPLAIRRTFWEWPDRTGPMITTAAADLPKKRLPWVSIQPPENSWTEMGAGQYDAEIDQMLNALDGINGPVWLTVNPEPESGPGHQGAPDDPDGPAAFRSMQSRVRQRMNALGTDNISFAPALQTWTLYPASGRNREDWFQPLAWDFVGLQQYIETPSTLLTAQWNTARQWVQTKGLPIAVSEWGMRGSDAAAGQRVRDWYEAAISSSTDGQGARVVGLAAFDSGLHSATGSWVLEGEQLEAFHDLMADPRTLDASEP